MKRLRKQWILMLLLVTVLSMAHTCISSAEAKMTEKKWQELTSDKAFGYKDQKEMQAIRQQTITSNAFSKFLGTIISFFSTPAGKTIIWIIFFALIGYILFRAFFSERISLFNKQKKEEQEEKVNTIAQPENILDTDWEYHLNQAAADGNMRFAIRFSYLHLLQLFQQKELINYRADKTNYDYYYELSNTTVKQPFRQLTRQYECAWYGNYPIQQDVYEAYMTIFNALKDHLCRS